MAIKYLSNSQCLHVCGPPGIGKTSFVKILGHYLHLREMYKDGVYYLDLKPAQNITKVNEMMQEIGVDLQPTMTGQKNMLLILDNCDNLLKKSAASVMILLKFFNKECGVSVVFTSIVEILDSEYTFERLSLEHLSPQEAAGLLIFNTRPLTKSELGTQ